MTWKPPLILIGCSATKRPGRAKARDLYRGALFRKSVQYAESRGYPWLVLSARYGAVGPDDVIQSYDVAMIQLDAEERAAWATTVYRQLRRRMALDRPIVFLAGALYRGQLLHRLKAESPYPVTAPLASCGIGVQKQRLAAAITTGESLD